MDAVAATSSKSSAKAPIHHGMTKRAKPGDPLLDIKIHGKRVTVFLHSSSVSKT